MLALSRGGKRLPVERWNPPHCGHSDMAIMADGTWFHAGTPIGRKELVQLFSSILRREPDGRHVLVTPVEKLDIDVADAPFVAVDADWQGSGPERQIVFRLNTDELVACGPDHGLDVRIDADGTPRPYLHVRGGLVALVNRATFYRLADLALAEGGEPPGLWSGGAFFAFMAG
ncbi:DUF1285 domain-containing protein [Sandarakinorhabdus rubra]|uniref:DUF1285 domain-containing protein n=1 Tax=Sandarakinorhabdus rubra TaxID=2672568 RepID=UPI001F41F60B|nr:DUF1285 domain-containing protein [Sandarakinorhabdus rubra]